MGEKDLKQRDLALSYWYPSRDEWLRARWNIGFGASDSPAFFGCGWKGKGALAAIMEKVEPLQIAPMTEKQEIASAMEPTVSMLYTRRTGRRAKPNGETIHYRNHVRHVFATPDAITDDGTRLVQIKVYAQTPDDWERGVPLRGMVQAQHEMFATRTRIEDFAVLFYGGGDLALRIYEVEANDDFQEILVERLTSAWNVVLARRAGEPAPLPDPEPDDADLMARLFARRPTVVHEFADADTELVQRWLSTLDDKRAYGSVVNALEKAEKADRAKILMRMAGAEFGVLKDGTRIVAKERSREAFPMPASTWTELAPAKDRRLKENAGE